MTTPRSHDPKRLYLVVRHPDGRTYRIPADDLAAYEMSAEESERIEAYLSDDVDTEGFAARVFGLGDSNVKPSLGRPLQSQGQESIVSAASALWDWASR